MIYVVLHRSDLKILEKSLVIKFRRMKFLCSSAEIWRIFLQNFEIGTVQRFANLVELEELNATK